MKKVSIKNLSKYYVKDNKKLKILNNINMDFYDNRFYAIVGHSGIGKTTFLMCICNLCEYNGSIFIDNKNYKLLSDKEISILRNRKIGIIFQDNNLIPQINIVENVTLPLLVNNNNIKKQLLISKKMLKSFDLQNRYNHYPNELSGGEQKKVAIARALINNPEIIIADEPTANLDSESKKIVLSMLSDLSKSGKCVIAVTHDNEIFNYADTIFKLEEGNLLKYEK